jgi:NlpC/P60 family putative phage cell wall peptidase
MTVNPDILHPAVVAARAWIGTPYVHGASTWGSGADCLGLLRGVWRNLYGSEPEVPGPYTPDWSEATREERLWEAARRHLDELLLSQVAPGDVLLFRMRRSSPAKHLGILAQSPGGQSTVVHAYSGVGVIESPLAEPWRRRLVAAFRFRERTG